MHPTQAVRVALVLVVLAGCTHPHPASPCAAFAPLSSATVAPIPVHRDRAPISYVKTVRVEGVDPDLSRTLVQQLETKPGLTLIENAPIQDDLRRLWKSGVIADARVEVGDDGDVVFVVTPRRTIENVSVRGFDRKSARRFELLAGATFEPSRLQRMADQAQLAYVRDGRLDARVEARHKVTPHGVDVCVRATPGPKLTIAHVHFPGRTAVPEDKLRSVLHGGDAKVNHIGGTFDRDALVQDALWIQAEYWEHGYAEIKVGEPRTRRVGNRLEVEVPITEGPRFTLGALTTSHPVDGGLALARGDLFVRSKIQKAREELLQRTGALDVVPLTRIDADRHVIDIEFELTWRWPWQGFRSLY